MEVLKVTGSEETAGFDLVCPQFLADGRPVPWACSSDARPSLTLRATTTMVGPYEFNVQAKGDKQQRIGRKSWEPVWRFGEGFRSVAP